MKAAKTAADVLADIGVALCGEQWKAPLADALGLQAAFKKRYEEVRRGK